MLTKPRLGISPLARRARDPHLHVSRDHVGDPRNAAFLVRDIGLDTCRSRAAQLTQAATPSAKLKPPLP